jgi:hypothetical protein
LPIADTVLACTKTESKEIKQPMKSERQDIELHSGEDLNMWESIESVEDEVPQSSDEFSLNSPQF